MGCFFSTCTNQQTNKLKARVSWCSRTSKPCVASQLAIKSPQTSTLNTFWKPPLLGVFFQIFQTFPIEKVPTTSGVDPIFSFDPNPKRSSLNQGLHRLVLQRGFFTSKIINDSTLPIIFTHSLSSTERDHHDHHTNSFKQTQTQKFSSQKIDLKKEQQQLIQNITKPTTSQPVNQETELIILSKPWAEQLILTAPQPKPMDSPESLEVFHQRLMNRPQPQSSGGGWTTHLKNMFVKLDHLPK